ncbi:MAG: MoaD/ThiS family protein [Hamadaea sp.]|uniref:MoaD/ThiS family protein n=1 Tax=Hamadaea sp. TaxID=2024425 RepID=UPI0017D2567F|nr:MoaD/ThiS family protein [Hamadaea sp.]NUO58450.1 MoaD/ThiS family protein [Hamadaea sp.]NUR71208.1 MoaD/ThiS family protein [Hamadaea sp.]NUT17739.1 MoaD/ThiS family protein [Hamadaea sp.]
MITVRYFAGARAAAGATEAELPDGSSVTELTSASVPALAKVLSASSFLVDGTAWRDRDQPLPAGCTLDVLPPFAGG